MIQLPPISTSTIQALLQAAFPPTDWILTKPDYGQQKQCYIARSQDQTVFVKVDSAPFAILKRLSDLAVTPQVFAGGIVQGRMYVIQDFLVGEHPWGWRWFPANLPLLARTIRCYHQDQVLHDLLASKAQQLDYIGHLHTEFAHLEQQLADLALDPPLAAELSKALAELRRQAHHLQPVALAPVHGDPNGLNFIIAGDQHLPGRPDARDWPVVVLVCGPRSVAGLFRRVWRGAQSERDRSLVLVVGTGLLGKCAVASQSSVRL
jgi:hypothetical protein